MQAGREVRVMVQPAEVDDLAAQVIAREIAKQIEDELTYPGQIRVTVVRESRVDRDRALSRPDGPYPRRRHDVATAAPTTSAPTGAR